ncbi:MAG TPA: glycosyltransferase [Nitrospira sp.]|nr:glycosyltransferase [Nitrospira sp.]
MLIPSWYPGSADPVNGIFVEDQAEVLAERFEVLVFVQRIYGWRQVAQGRLPSRAGFAMRRGIRLYEQSIVLPPRLPYRAVAAYLLRRARAAMQTILHEWGSPDIIHPHVVLPGGWVGTRLGRLLNVPVVLTEHTGPFSAHLTSSSRRALVRETLRASNRVIAVSPSLSDQINAVDPLLKIEVLGNVIPTRFFFPVEGDTSEKGTPLRLFSASLLTKGKGYEYLLRAARMLLDAGFHRFQLVIGGDGPDRPRLDAMITELNLRENCSMVGMLTRDELRDRMRRSDLFVFPSLAETFGMVIGEAMACGKPVLATHCGGADFQVTPKTGLLVKPGSAEALAEGVRHFAEKRSEYSAAGIHAAVAERFGETAFLDAVTCIYHDVAVRKVCA